MIGKTCLCHLYWTYYVLSTELSALKILTNLILSTTLRSRHYHYPCFTNEDTRQRLKWWICDHGHWWSGSRTVVLDYYAIPTFGTRRSGVQVLAVPLTGHAVPMGRSSKLCQLVLSPLLVKHKLSWLYVNAYIIISLIFNAVVFLPF